MSYKKWKKSLPRHDQRRYRMDKLHADHPDGFIIKSNGRDLICLPFDKWASMVKK